MYCRLPLAQQGGPLELLGDERRHGLLHLDLALMKGGYSRWDASKGSKRSLDIDQPLCDLRNLIMRRNEEGGLSLGPIGQAFRSVCSTAEPSGHRLEILGGHCGGVVSTLTLWS
jgi:hypothetical protein